MLETVLLEDTSMRNITPNVFFQQLRTLPVLCSGIA